MKKIKKVLIVMLIYDIITKYVNNIYVSLEELEYEK